MLGNVAPKPAIVKPRVISPRTGEPMLLEDLANLHLSHGRGGMEVVGGPGSGKSTALAHLASLPFGKHLIFLDDAGKHPVPSVPTGKALIVSNRLPASNEAIQLAHWTEDDLIEYLLVSAPEQCGEILTRFKSDSVTASLEGNPQLITMVAEQLIQRPDCTISEALRRAIKDRVPDENVARHARLFAASRILNEQDVEANVDMEILGAYPGVLQLLGHRIVRLHFATQYLVRQLEYGNCLPSKMLPLELIHQLADGIKSSEAALSFVRRHINRDKDPRVAVAASILQSMGLDWCPKVLAHMCLQGGHFPGVDWQARKLLRVNLAEADVSEASLESASLRGAFLKRADIRRSDLANANLTGAVAAQANFSFADLSKATMGHAQFDDCLFLSTDLTNVLARSTSFTGARFTNARLNYGTFQGSNFDRALFEDCDLRYANFERAYLARVDLRRTKIDGVKFRQANLRRAVLEGVSIQRADFSDASLKGALLTDSTFVDVRLADANLTGAGLADIDWTNCDLTNANFENCSFHLGSTRCGHVDSPYPSHGTRTGFYTDDFEAHQYRSPEEIRKAALCGCDLRGADVE